MRKRVSHDDGLQRAAPGETGVDSAAILAFLDDVAADGLEMHTIMLHRRGRLVLEGGWWPYSTDQPRMAHSVTKSFTACAIGLALEEGLIALHDKVVSFFPEHLPPLVGDNLAAMTIEDLLTMRCGHAEETSGALWRGRDTSWIGEFFKIPVVHRPGTVHVYTSAASYMLSAILTRTTGETLHDYLRPRLFEPLGIAGERWDLGPDGINPGGNGLTCKPVDLLKLGILHAQKGKWNGKPILSERWVEAATRPQGDPRYGYHWVVGENGAFLALGVFVQMVVVFPAAEAVLAITGGMRESAQIRPLIDRHFPGAFQDSPLADRGADARLAARLATFDRAPKLGGKPMPLAARISGIPFKAACNPLGITGIRIHFLDERYVFTLDDGEGAHTLVGSVGRWIETDAALPGRDLHHGYDLAPARIVAGAEWRDANTFEMTWIYAETAFRDTVTCRFEGDGATLERRVNTNSGPLAWPSIRLTSR